MGPFLFWVVFFRLLIKTYLLIIPEWWEQNWE